MSIPQQDQYPLAKPHPSKGISDQEAEDRMLLGMVLKSANQAAKDGQRWNVHDRIKQKVIDAVERCLDSKNMRFNMMAAKIAALLERQNQIDQLEEKRPAALTQHLHLHSQQLNQEDPEFVEFKRMRALQRQKQAIANQSTQTTMELTSDPKSETTIDRA